MSHHAVLSSGGHGNRRQQRGGALGPAILLAARLQFGTVLAVGLVAAVALGLWAAAPPFLDQVGAAQLQTTVRTAGRDGDLSLTSRPTSYDPPKVQNLDAYVARSGAPIRLAGRVLASAEICPSTDGPAECSASTPKSFLARSGDLDISGLSGRLPATGEVAVARPLAQQLNIAEGATLTITPGSGRPEAAVTATVSGLFDPGRETDPLWRDLPTPPSGAILMPGAALEPLLANPAGTYGAVVVSRFRVDPKLIHPGSVRQGEGATLNLISRLPVDQDVAISTGLPDLLKGAADNERSLGGPIRTVLALCLLLLGAAATAVASLAIDARKEDIGLLKARGAGSAQVVAVFAIGLAVMLGAALALAPLIGAGLAAAAGWLPPLRAASGGRSFPFRPTGRSLGLAAPAAILIAAAALVPFVRAARTTPVGVRRERARPSRRSAVQQGGLDLAVIAGAVVLVLSLHARGLVFAKPGSGDVAFDPLGVAAPAALLLAVGLLSLRVFAPAARGVGSVSAKGRGVVMPLASWELGRDPLPRARLALLLVLAVGLGAYATVYDATLQRAARERAAFQVGADARRDLVSGPLTGVKSTPVWRGQLILGEGIAPVSTLGVDPGIYSDVLAWPTNGSAAPVVRQLATPTPTAGLTLPAGAREVTFDLDVKSNPDLLVPLAPPGRIVARVVGADGRLTNVTTTPFRADAGPVTAQLAVPPGAQRIDALLFDQPDGGAFVGGFSATISQISVDGNPADAFGHGFWHPASGTGRCHSRTYTQSATEGGNGLTITMAGALFYDCAPAGAAAWTDAPVPVIISKSLAVGQGWRAGQNVELRIAGAGGSSPFTAHVIAVEDRFATLAPDDQLDLTSGVPSGFVIADLAALQARWARVPGWAAIAPDTSLPLPTETWAAGPPPLPEATTGLLLRTSVAKSISEAPLQQALEGATLAGVGMALLVALGSLGAQLALSARRRRRQLGVLRSLGLDRTQLLGVLGVEYLLLALLALLVAIPAGIVLLRVLLPFIDLGGNGQAVVPPTRMIVPGEQLALLGAGVLFATAIAVGVAFIAAVQARLHDVLRLGDD